MTYFPKLSAAERHPLFIGGLVGWAALELVYLGWGIAAVWRNPNLGPEIGPVGTLIFFALWFSFRYWVIYIFFGVPIYFLLRHHLDQIGRIGFSLCGAVLYAICAFLWSSTGPGSGQGLIDAAFVSIGGGASFFTLKTLKFGNSGASE